MAGSPGGTSARGWHLRRARSGSSGHPEWPVGEGAALSAHHRSSLLEAPGLFPSGARLCSLVQPPRCSGSGSGPRAAGAVGDPGGGAAPAGLSGFAVAAWGSSSAAPGITCEHGSFQHRRPRRPGGSATGESYLGRQALREGVVRTVRTREQESELACHFSSPQPWEVASFGCRRGRKQSAAGGGHAAPATVCEAPAQPVFLESHLQQETHRLAEWGGPHCSKGVELGTSFPPSFDFRFSCLPSLPPSFLAALPWGCMAVSGT